MQGKEAEFRRRFRTRVLIPGTLVFLFTVALTGFGLYSAGRGVDELSMQGQQFEALRAVGRGLNELSLAQETLGICDDCEGGASPDSGLSIPWMSHIADNMDRLYDVDRTYVLDRSDRPVFAAAGATRIASSEFTNNAAEVMPFVDRVRGRSVRPNNYHERLPGPGELPELASVRTSDTAIHSTDLAMIEGRPAVVSVMRMSRTAIQTPVLANVRFMDESFLADISTQNFIAEPRFAENVVLGDGERSIAISDSQGVPITNLVWKPMLPSSELVESQTGWALLAVLVIAAMILSMAMQLRHVMRRDVDRVHELEQAHCELQAKEAQAHHLAYHDPLTGLPNRAMFVDRAEQALIAARHGKRVAVLLLDVDRFKFVNDRFGHLAGDALVQQVGKRLTAAMRDGETVARLGGDEFAMLVEPLESEDRLEELIAEVLAVIEQPFELMGNQAHVTASIGIAIAPDCGTDRTELLRKADIALYRAKEEGRNRARRFTEEMDESVLLRTELEADLRKALDNGNGLSVHYQPQVDADGDLVGVEALARWSHAEHGAIPPSIFIPIAEETGLIGAIGDLVLDHACRVAGSRPELSVAVNLSPAQFHTPNLAEHLVRIVSRHGVDPFQIEFEVTESVVLDPNDGVRGTLIKLRKAGFRIALDDFGTGYSSLSCLREFEVDKIKIDKSFVQSLGRSGDADAIVTAVISLGHAMGLAVTAEGVETDQQREFLRRAGCEQMQGFLFSKAIPVLASAKGTATTGTFLSEWDRRQRSNVHPDRMLRRAG